LKLNAATASETIMIGDSYEADIVGAQNAGVDQIYYCPLSSEINNLSTYNVKNLMEIMIIL